MPGMFQTMDHVMLTLEAEAASARSLAAQGIELLRGLDSVAINPDPVLACLSLAAEKMLKLTIGLGALDQGKGWPSRGQMTGYGHTIGKVNEQVMLLCMENLHLAEHRPVPVMAALGSLDMTWTAPLLAALANYGDGGRLYILDNLANDRQRHPSSVEIWAAMEEEVIAKHPEVLYHLAAGTGTNREARGPMNRHLARAFSAWWNFYSTAWKHGVVGERGKRLGPALSLRKFELPLGFEDD